MVRVVISFEPVALSLDNEVPATFNFENGVSVASNLENGVPVALSLENGVPVVLSLENWVPVFLILENFTALKTFKHFAFCKSVLSFTEMAATLPKILLKKNYQAQELQTTFFAACTLEANEDVEGPSACTDERQLQQ